MFVSVESIVGLERAKVYFSEKGGNLCYQWFFHLTLTRREIIFEAIERKDSSAGPPLDRYLGLLD